MDESVILLIEPKLKNSYRIYPSDLLIRIIDKNDDCIEAVRQKGNRWTLLHIDKTYDSDTESLFDEELIMNANPDPYKEKDQHVEVNRRVVKSLEYLLELLKCDEDQEWVDEFDPSHPEKVKDLIEDFQKFNVIPEPPKIPLIQTKYTDLLLDPYATLMMVRKSAHYKGLKDLYVVFCAIVGSCSTTYRPFRIYSNLDAAKNMCKKLHNLFACKYFHGVLKDHTYDSNGLCSASIHEFIWDTKDQNYVHSKAPIIDYLDGESVVPYGFDSSY